MSKVARPDMEEMSLTISPSEALLLGLCIGELQGYARESQSPPRKVFLDILRDRLEPHIPPFRAERRVPISDDRLPKDIEWHGTFPSMGFSLSQNHKYYLAISDGHYQEVSVDTSRLSLFDWLILAISPHMAMSLRDRVLYPPEAIPHLADHLLLFLDEELAKSHMTDPSAEKRTSENGREIQAIVNRLVAKNECTHIYDIGVKFGNLVYEVDAFEQYVWNVEDEKAMFVGDRMVDEMERLSEEVGSNLEQEFDAWVAGESKVFIADDDNLTDERLALWRKRIEEKREQLFDVELPELDPAEFEGAFSVDKVAVIGLSVERLLATDLVRRCQHAEGVLKTLLSPAKTPRFKAENMTELGNYHPAQLATIPGVAYARMAVWLAFGEVLGVLRDADSEAGVVDANSMVPRAFRLLPADTPESVRTRLLRIEQELGESVDVDAVEIVVRLSPAIEALAKRVWPQEFVGRTWPGNLMSVLCGKLSSGSDLEKRFAGISLTLLKQYRNPATHDLDGFKCSLEEARFFLVGIRTLLGLWERLSEN